ncbi:MAG: thiamine pyrophosphate-dependent dehydrogenase E1 component subunit alpha [Elusimicrobia bacterium]|nr:thiamine pyrophosphate-dependent dehydrogenase E1 component subunit alpha [Elusimicrobiota bacterium]
MLKTAGKGADEDLALYRLMLKIRLAEERIVAIYPTDKIQSPIHLSIGQEAVAAGVCMALAAGDHIHGTYRGHGIYIAKGGDLGRMFAELYGKDAGCAGGKGGSMHLAAQSVGLVGCSAIVAGLIPVATGDALAARMQGSSRVVCSFFGDGAVDEGVFFESVNFAVLKGLPIVYVCENNGYAIHSRVADRHKQDKLFRLAEGLGLRGRRYDGNDARTVFKTMSRAVAAARRGAAPVLLEYMTSRWHEHVGPGTDFQEAYRHPKDRANAAKNDPIRKMAARLKRRGLSAGRLEAVAAEIRRDVDRAVAFAEESPFPPIERLHADLYAESR